MQVDKRKRYAQCRSHIAAVGELDLLAAGTEQRVHCLSSSVVQHDCFVSCLGAASVFRRAWQRIASEQLRPCEQIDGRCVFLQRHVLQRESVGPCHCLKSDI